MNSFTRHYSFFRENIFLMLGLSLVVYFSYHGVFGHRGVLSLMELQGQLEISSAQLSALESDKQALERKVSMMRPAQVNADMAEELIHEKLGYSVASHISIVGFSPIVAQQ